MLMGPSIVLPVRSVRYTQAPDSVRPCFSKNRTEFSAAFRNSGRRSIRLYNAENVHTERACDQMYLSPLSTVPSSDKQLSTPPHSQSMPCRNQNGTMSSSNK